MRLTRRPTIHPAFFAGQVAIGGGEIRHIFYLRTGVAWKAGQAISRTNGEWHVLLGKDEVAAGLWYEDKKEAGL